jgi:hypothetical protein
VARTPFVPRRKRRTREHVIADLGVNHTERQALLAGFTVERVIHDYGIDLVLFTYNAGGEIEAGHLLIQVKFVEYARKLADGDFVVFRAGRKDLLAWFAEVEPVMLVVYDATEDRAWWLCIQDYFEGKRRFDPGQLGATVSLRLPSGRVLDPANVRRFAEIRDRRLRPNLRIVDRHEG